jgi:vitamin B12 transporter
MHLFRLLPWLVMALIPFALSAQTDTTKQNQVRDTTLLNPLFIIDKSNPVPYLSLPAPLHMSRIDRGTIAASVAGDLPALLKGITGADVRERGPHDVQADIALRGGSFEQSLIMLNGVPYNDPQTGHHSLNLPFSVNDIEQIEVSGPGGMTTPHSGYAMSGAVSIATKTNSALNNLLQTEVSVGSFGYRRGYAAVMFPTQKVGHYISVESSGSEGYVPNTDFTRRHLWYAATRKTGSHGRITFQGGWMNKAFGANSFYTAKYPNQFEEISTAGGMLLIQGGQRVRWSGYLSSRLHHDRFELFREDAPEWYAGHNYHRTHINSTGFNGSLKSKFGITSFITHLRYEQILSNVLGEPSDTLPVKGTDAQFTRKGQRHQGEVALRHHLTLKKIDVAAQFTTAMLPGGTAGGFPSARMTYPLGNQSLQMSAAISRNYRLPTFTELYYKGPTNTGNPALQHEEAITIETGVVYENHPFYTSATVYLRDNKNLIDWVKEDGETMWRSENLTRITTLGTHWHGTMILPVTQWFPRNISLGYAWAHQTKSTPHGTLSYYILDHLRHKWTLEVLQRPLNGRLNITWYLVWQQRAGSYTDLAGLEQPYPDAMLLNLSVKYRLTEVLEFNLKAHNIFNTKQFDFSGIPLPGRWITGSVVIRTPFGV